MPRTGGISHDRWAALSHGHHQVIRYLDACVLLGPARGFGSVSLPGSLVICQLSQCAAVSTVLAAGLSKPATSCQHLRCGSGKQACNAKPPTPSFTKAFCFAKWRILQFRFSRSYEKFCKDQQAFASFSKAAASSMAGLEQKLR